jgi:hypothetical protein
LTGFVAHHDRRVSDNPPTKTLDSSTGDFYASDYDPILSLFDSLPSRLSSYVILSSASVVAADTESPMRTAPKVDHILLEVSNLDVWIAFYRDLLGLRLKSRSHDFVMLESDDVGIFL